MIRIERKMEGTNVLTRSVVESGDDTIKYGDIELFVELEDSLRGEQVSTGAGTTGLND
jgi:hypothetical protein